MKEWDKAREEFLRLLREEPSTYLHLTEQGRERLVDQLMAKFLVKAEDQSLPKNFDIDEPAKILRERHPEAFALGCHTAFKTLLNDNWMRVVKK